MMRTVLIHGFLCLPLALVPVIHAEESTDEAEVEGIDWVGKTLAVLDLLVEGKFEEVCLYFDEGLMKRIAPKSGLY